MSDHDPWFDPEPPPAPKPRPTLNYADPSLVSPAGANVPRCIACGYLLIGLTRGRCPECGQKFNLDDDTSFTDRPPFSFIVYWAPAVIALSACWVVLSLVFLQRDSIGFALTLCVPATVGFVASYGFRGPVVRTIFLGCFSLIVTVVTLVSMHAVGVFCGVILGILFLLPFTFGAALGSLLRTIMKEVPRYSQGRHLPVLLALLLPAIVELAERGLTSPPPPESQTTVVRLRGTLPEAWHAQIGGAHSVQTHPLHDIKLTRPLEQVGPRGVGDESTIRFSKGELRIRVTERVPLTRFRFDYVGQSHVEDRAIRLIETSFDYDALGPDMTQVSISTRYDPLMTPRWYWRPFERWAGRVTHEQIGRQMQRDIDARPRETIAREQ